MKEVSSKAGKWGRANGEGKAQRQKQDVCTGSKLK